jgi:hypothetical protein
MGYYKRPKAHYMDKRILLPAFSEALLRIKAECSVRNNRNLFLEEQNQNHLLVAKSLHGYVARICIHNFIKYREISVHQYVDEETN